MSKTTCWMIISGLLTLLCILERIEREKEENRHFKEIWELKKAMFSAALSINEGLAQAKDRNDDYHRAAFIIMKIASDMIIEDADLKDEFDEISKKRERWMELTRQRP